MPLTSLSQVSTLGSERAGRKGLSPGRWEPACAHFLPRPGAAEHGAAELASSEIHAETLWAAPGTQASLARKCWRGLSSGICWGRSGGERAPALGVVWSPSGFCVSSPALL